MRLNELPEHNNNKEDANSDQPKTPGREELVRFFESADTNSQLEMRIAIKMQDREQVLNLLEAGGYIPVNSKEAQDPRFKTALSVDIKPGEVQRQAKKMGFSTDPAGIPPLLHKSAAKNTSANKAYNLGLTESVASERQITQQDLDALEAYADKLFSKVGIDVEFTRHFLDRVNDERNLKQISMAELTRLFKQEFKRWGKKIAQLGPDAQAVMKDMKTDVNIPFVLVWDKNNQELDLIAKTVMRKDNFKTSNPEFAIETVDPILAFIQDKGKTYELSYGNCGILAIALDQKFDMDKFVYVTNDAEPDKLYHVAAVKNGKIYDADGITNISNVRARGLDDEYPDEEPQVDHVPAVQTEYSYILKGTDSDIGPEDLLEDVGSAAAFFSQFNPEEIKQIAIALGVTIPVLQTMFYSINGYRKIKKAISGLFGSKKKKSGFAVEDGPLASLQRLLAPKIKKDAYDYAAKTLHDVIQRKKSAGQKLVHQLEYYAQRVGSNIRGIDYKALVDYYIDQYGVPESYSELEQAVLESGYSLDDLDENFADGKKPGRKGLAKRVGVDCSKSVTALRKIAKNSSGEKQRMAHWCANMKSGKQKK